MVLKHVIHNVIYLLINIFSDISMLIRSLWYVICIQKRDEAYFMTLLKTVETTPGLYYSCEVDLSLRWVISMVFANNFILKGRTEMEVPESCGCFTACKKTVFNNISEAVIFCFCILNSIESFMFNQGYVNWHIPFPVSYMYDHPNSREN